MIYRGYIPQSMPQSKAKFDTMDVRVLHYVIIKSSRFFPDCLSVPTEIVVFLLCIFCIVIVCFDTECLCREQ